MTFEEQTAGIPLALVQQGWRRMSSFEPDAAWRASDPSHRWNYSTIDTNGSHIRIAQPVVLMEGCRIYAHAGWGEGLAPTAETVKIWPFWWLSAGNDPKPVSVTVHDGQMVIDGLRGRYLGLHRWHGPVLPPMVTP